MGTLLLSADIIEINRQPHVIATGLDITQRKQAEVELLRTLAREKELGQLRRRWDHEISRARALVRFPGSGSRSEWNGT